MSYTHCMNSVSIVYSVIMCMFIFVIILLSSTVADNNGTIIYKYYTLYLIVKF